jgi:hypothetical protein
VGVFPAVSLGWRLSEESFFEKLRSNTPINMLKIRGSWGEQGNQNGGATGDFAMVSTVGSSSANPYPNYDMAGNNTTSTQGYSVIRRGNPNLKWETTTQYNAGLDMALFDNKVELVFEYYTKHTNDILYPKPQLAAVGEGANPIVNSGSLYTNGFDLTLAYNYYNADNDFRFDANFQMSHANTIVQSIDPLVGAMGYDGKIYLDGYGSSRIVEGQPLGVFYGWEVEGIFQSD